VLVVLDRVDSPFDELDAMEDVLERHSIANDTVVSAMTAAQAELSGPGRPALIRALAEGKQVA
jgi:hypothetical protein